MSSSSKTFKCDYNEQKQTLNDVPLWKLFIDKQAQQYNDPMVFDEYAFIGGKAEPGYHSAMTKAFDYMLKNINKKINADEFQCIHHLCVDAVKNVGSNKKGFSPGGYGFDEMKVTEQAKAEWKSEKLIFTAAALLAGEKAENYLSLIRPIPGADIGCMKVCSLSEGESQDAISKTVNDICEDYYSKIKEAKEDDAKLSAIVSFCRKLEIGHFFADGNQRTIVFVILNKLLIENGFTPVILEDPFAFDGYLSKSELVDAVKKGQEYFLECAKENTIENTNEKTPSPSGPTSSSSTLFSPQKSMDSKTPPSKTDAQAPTPKPGGAAGKKTE